MKFAVVGDPVMHSRSPQIHNAGFAELGLDAEFVHMLVAADQFDAVIDALRSGDLRGVSVTMPHKTRAYDAVDSRSDNAYESGAVNSIVTTGGQLVGHNSDVYGVQYAVEKLAVPTDTPVLVLGAGGAAGAVLVALRDRVVHVSARDSYEAKKLVSRRGATGGVVPWGEPVQGAIVVNATPLGMNGEDLPDGVMERAGSFVDMVYGDEATPAVRHAANFGMPYADGVDVLVGQAVRAFKIFTGRSVSIHVLDAAARSD